MRPPHIGNGLLARLDGVIELGHGKYKAKCPSHDDRTPSLHIKECDDGHTLIHCFAGCESESVLDAVGLTFAALFKEGSTYSHIKPQKWLNASDAIATLDHEALVVAIIGADFLEHKEIDEPTWSRLAQSVERINSARAIAAPMRHHK